MQSTYQTFIKKKDINMSLPKIEVNPSDLQRDFENYFDRFFEHTNSNGYTFKTPVTIVFDAEADDKVFVTGIFRNTNAFDEKVYSTYVIYYDGCNCPHLIDDPSGRYTISPLDKSPLSHQWMVYSQCEIEINEN